MEVGAEPQTALPISNSPIADIKTHLLLKREYARPNGSWKAQVVRRNAALYQETSLRLLNWLVIVGIAVAIIVASSATRKVDVQRATKMSAKLSPDGYVVSSMSSSGVSRGAECFEVWSEVFDGLSRIAPIGLCSEDILVINLVEEESGFAEYVSQGNRRFIYQYTVFFGRWLHTAHFRRMGQTDRTLAHIILKK